MYPWYRDSVAAAAAAGLGGPVGVVGSGFCSTGPGQGGTTIKTESGYSDCMLALDYVQSKVSNFSLRRFFSFFFIGRRLRCFIAGPFERGINYFPSRNCLTIILVSSMIIL